MEKESNSVCILSLDIFNKYWELLLLNYNQKHTQEIEQKRKLHYSIFKNTDEKDFKKAIQGAIKHQQYFPNVHEIYKYLPKEEPVWFNKEIEKETASDEEINELEDLFKDFREDK